MLGFVKMKARRGEVSKVAWLWFNRGIDIDTVHFMFQVFQFYRYTCRPREPCHVSILACVLNTNGGPTHEVEEFQFLCLQLDPTLQDTINHL